MRQQLQQSPGTSEWHSKDIFEAHLQFAREANDDKHGRDYVLYMLAEGQAYGAD